jgi:alpha/beta superfamily hydrolase
MLEKNFDGRHFWVESKTDKDLKIDSMFFPCTNEKVLNREELKEKRDSKINDPEYLSRPTVIMCNPNALFYHHMVNSPNSYWLSFFLKKGINVMGWNYRGYGHTKGSCTPYNIKADGESIFNFVVNELQLSGKVGMYGRSLGGVVASHISATYPD